MSTTEALCIKLTAVFLSILLLLSLPVEAKPKTLPCKEEVRVVGDARPGQSWADSSVLKVWRKEVASRFGDAYARVENAKNLRTRCYDGPLKTTRCEMIARPCEVQF